MSNLILTDYLSEEWHDSVTLSGWDIILGYKGGKTPTRIIHITNCKTKMYWWLKFQYVTYYIWLENDIACKIQQNAKNRRRFALSTIQNKTFGSRRSHRIKEWIYLCSWKIVKEEIITKKKGEKTLNNNKCTCQQVSARVRKQDSCIDTRWQVWEWLIDILRLRTSH